MDFKGLIGMPEHANVEGVQRRTLLCEVALVQGLANPLAILYQGHGFQFNLLKKPLPFVQLGHLTVQTGARAITSGKRPWPMRCLRTSSGW